MNSNIIKKNIPIDWFLLVFLVGAHILHGVHIFYLKSDNFLVTPLILAVVFVYLFVGFITKKSGLSKIIFPVKLSIIFIFIFIFVVIPVLNNIEAHIQSDFPQNSDIHDSSLVIKEATRFFLNGKNPYVEKYDETPLGKWIQGFPNTKFFLKRHPALDHYVYLPATFVIPAIFLLFRSELVDYFDPRMLHLIMFFILIVFLLRVVKSKIEKLICLALFCLSPFFSIFFVWGTTDILIFFWLFVAIYLLYKNRFFWSAILLGIGLATKHIAILLLPFYLFYLYKFFKELSPKARIKKIVAATLPAWIILLAFVMPFFIWNPAAFFDDTYKYIAGTSESNYPISGYGFSAFVYQLGWVKSPTDYFPFWTLQFIFIIPLGVYLLLKQNRNNTPRQVWFNYAFVLIPFYFFARFFNPGYIGFLFMILISAFFMENKMPQKIDNLKKVHSKVPPDYYDEGIKRNIFQKIWHEEKFRKIKNLIPKKPLRRVLDVGAASGLALERFVKGKDIKEICAIDFIPKMVEYGRRKRPRFNWIVANAHNLPFDDNYFDLIFLIETLEHLKNPLVALKETKRVLKDDGKIIVLVSSENLIFKTIWFFWTLGRGRVWKNAHKISPKPIYWEKLFKKARLRVARKIKTHLGLEYAYVLKKN